MNVALETMQSKNQELKTLTSRYKKNPQENINPMSMLLNGVIDAAVMGGIANYNKVNTVSLSLSLPLSFLSLSLSLPLSFLSLSLSLPLSFPPSLFSPSLPSSFFSLPLSFLSLPLSLSLALACFSYDSFWGLETYPSLRKNAGVNKQVTIYT